MDLFTCEYGDFDIDVAKWRKPKTPGISGCFRLRDEAQFMERSILSHLPYLDEVVLVTQPSNDETVEIAERLAETYGKVQHYHYPFDVRFIDHKEWATTPENSVYSFVYLSNWALSKCRFSWIAKTEGDVIALTPFGTLCDTVRENDKRPAYYGRVILNVAGEHCDKVSFENVRNGGWDECIVPNHPDYHFIRREKWEVMVHPDNIPQICAGWSALHMKRCKREFLPGPWNGEHYVPFTRNEIATACANYNNTRQPYPGTDNWPLGGPMLFEKEALT